MADFYTASALNWTPYGAEYYNTNRGLIDNNSLVLSANFVEHPALSGIKDIAINHDTIFYLTKKKQAKDLFTNFESITAFSLSSLPLSASTMNIGTSGTPAYAKYYYCANLPQYNRTTDFRTVDYNTTLNYILFSAFKDKSRSYSPSPSNPFVESLSVFQFNFSNLKNTMTPYYEYDSCIATSIRDYEKLYVGTNQRYGYANMFLGYSSNLTQLKFPHNETTYFHYPHTATQIPLSSTCLVNRGAKAGNSPMNSDIIAIDQSGYYPHTSSGPNSVNNGLFLCAWLSGSNDCSCGARWVERWYDPNTVTQGNAYITSVNSGSCENIWDVATTMQLIPKVRYYYDRYGKDRNEVVVDTLSGLIAHYDVWKNDLVDSTLNENDGYIIDKYTGPSSAFELDGSLHAHIPPTDQLLNTERQLTVGACVYKKDWCCGKNSQIVGNYHFGGWGIFYNTGMPNNILTIGDSTGNVFSFNIDGTRIFEKSLDRTDELNNIHIDYIATDLNGARWILDNHNKRLYKIDVDDILVDLVNFPGSYDIEKIQINANNRVYAHDKTTSKVFVHDEVGNYIETISAPTTATLFELDSNGNILFDIGDIMAINSSDEVYKVWGSNLYRDGEIIFHFPSRIMDLKIDDEDNAWVVFRGNVLVKITPENEMEFQKTLFSFLKDERNTKIGITRKSNRKGCDENRVWLVFEHNKQLVELDGTGRVNTSINADDLIVSQGCYPYKLRANGDFTGYDINRKFETAGGDKVSPSNPSLTLRVKFKNQCNSKLFKAVHIPVCSLESGWHHVGMSYNSNSGKLKFFIDGILVGTEQLTAGLWNIDYNEITPIIIGGNSGKLGSENVEKSILNDQYFIGKIDDVRIYNLELGEFDIKALADYKVGSFDDLIWNIQTNNRSYIEKVDQFFMNKKPGHTSKKFNIKINGLNISSDLKLLVESAINSSISNLIPKYTELNSIVWG